jgi:hypothetical protein
MQLHMMMNPWRQLLMLKEILLLMQLLKGDAQTSLHRTRAIFRVYAEPT